MNKNESNTTHVPTLKMSALVGLSEQELKIISHRTAFVRNSLQSMKKGVDNTLPAMRIPTTRNAAPENAIRVTRKKESVIPAIDGFLLIHFYVHNSKGILFPEIWEFPTMIKFHSDPGAEYRQ